MSIPLSTDQRKAILERVVGGYARNGWRIQNLTETRAQLVKPAQKKSCFLIVVLLILGLIPGILYLMWPSEDKLLVIEIDGYGNTHMTPPPGRRSRRLWLFAGGAVVVLILVPACSIIFAEMLIKNTGDTAVGDAPEGIDAISTVMPVRVMYFCEIERCKLSPSYGLVFDPQGTPVWQNHDPDRGRVLRMADNHEKIRVIREVRVRDGWGGLWYELEGGGWTNEMHLTDEPCTPENVERYSTSDC